MTDVVIVPTGTANLASVAAGFSRLGCRVRVTSDVTAIADATAVVVPGVGSFGTAMTALDASGASDGLRTRIDRDRPTLCVCVGFQVLGHSSTESPESTGLGVVDGRIVALPPGGSVPQLGWNRVETDSGARVLCDGWAYFANSYRLAAVPGDWVGAWTHHGGRLVAGIERGAIVGCQFHPELSGAYGSGVLGRWLDVVREVA
ncbi:MAG: imidazole glycerol phosphate synthase subunit HisH [Acidimicrobiia bacterium]|nr:imidazole glycerol phosphate synthase subunit HisH [Acidimicrobiia bacterium]